MRMDPGAAPTPAVSWRHPRPTLFISGRRMT
jgi:hypothetical protein